MIRVAILGCARIARRSLAPAFDRHGAYMLTAVASRTPEKAKAFASAFGARACSYEEAVSSGNVDLVYCPLPTGLHYEWVKRALENGKHVLCEKSLTCSPAQTLRLVELARQAGVLLMESFQFRFHAQNVFVRDFIAAGALGRILSVEARFSFPRLPDPADIRFDRALGGGGLLDAGAYAVKASSYLLGKGLSVVSAEVKRDAMSPVDIAGSCVLRRTDGVESHASYSMDAAYCCGYTVAFEKGSVSTTRAFTARDDYSAEVCIRTEAGEDVRTFVDDHFARLLDYVSERIAAREFEEEYSECLEQARLQGEVARLGGYDTVNRYAVFGSNGYLASQIRSYLDGRGVAYDEFDLPEADVTSDAFWRTFDPARYSAVLFFAGLAGPAASNAKKDLYGRVNVGGLGNLLSMLAPLGPCAPKVVFPSTRLVYKGSDAPLGEEARKEARSVYAQNKLDCESLLSKCHDESDVPYVVLRLCVPYGSLVSHDYSYGTVGLFFRQAKDGTITLYGDGSQRRTFTHVADFCRIVAEMAANGETGVFNVGGESRSLMEVAQAIADRTGARVACIPWPPEALALESGSTVFDSSKLDAIVGSDYRTIDDLS